MAGGTWIDQNKLRPGVYINYSSVPSTLSSMGERGVVCVPKQMSWGESEKFIVIENPAECFDKLGYDQLSDEMFWLRQLLLGTNRTSGASKLLIWRLGSTGGAQATATYTITTAGTKASVTIGNLTVTAKTAGTAGNAIKVMVDESGGGKFTVTTMNGGGTTYDTITGVSSVEEVKAYTSTVVDFSGIGALTKTDSPESLTGGTEGSSTGELTATARYEGVRGNDISVLITPDPDNESTHNIYYVQTLVSGKVVDSQILESCSSDVPFSQLSDNTWVTFEATGNVSALSMTLSGGSNGSVSSDAFSNFLSAAELETWNIVTYGGSDSVTKSAITSFVKRLCNEEGKKVQACLYNYPSADSECVISVYPQHITDLSNHTFTDEEMVCWVAGASAGASVSESLTYASHPEASLLTPNLTSSQQVDALNNGQFAFIEEFGAIKNLQDNNTFTTFSPTKSKTFRKNRVIRTLFGFANDTYKVYSQYYIGNTNNDEFGRNLLKSELIELLNRYQGAGAVKNVVADDITVSEGTDSDAVVIEENIQPIDSVEKIYINITIQ